MDARPPLIAVGSLIVIRPERNYDDSFETVRDAVVFEIPQSSQADKVTFGFEDTGTSQHPGTQVNAKFSWTVSD
jgi:hypothetical protein